MKNWLLLMMTIVFLAACGDDEESIAGPKVEKLDEVNEDVQALIDMTEDDKFASVIYSEVATSYLLLNATGKVEVEFAPQDTDLHINITQTDDGSPEKVDDVAYSFILDQPYDKIHIFQNGEEMPFEVWYE